MLPHQLQYGTGSRTSYGTGSRTDSHRDCLINSTNSSDGSELAADFELYIVWVVRYCLGALLFRRAIVWVVSDNIQWCLNYTARISLWFTVWTTNWLPPSPYFTVTEPGWRGPHCSLSEMG